MLLAVTSSQEDRDVMVACLQLGAADYMIKPLRHNELRNLWARVYWWRRVRRPLLAVSQGDTCRRECGSWLLQGLSSHAPMPGRPSICSSRRRWSWAPRSTARPA